MVRLKLIAILVGMAAAGLQGAYGGESGSPEPEAWSEAGYDLLDDGAYGLNIEGQWTVGPGPDSIPWGIWFMDSQAILLADIQPTDPGSSEFREVWETETAPLLGRLAKESLGGELISFSPLKEAAGSAAPVYGMEYTYSRGDTTFYVTVCYRFCDTYTLELIGIDPDSRERGRRVAVNAADSFADMGGPQHAVTLRPEEMMGSESWPWKYLHNPFAVSAYYMDIESPPPPSQERRLTDYEIRWKDQGMETLVRAVIGKPEGAVMSSDLDRVEEFALIGWLGDFYRVRTNDRTVEISREGLAINTIADIEEFKNLRVLDIELTDLEDVSPIASMTQLESLSLMAGSDLADLEFLRPLENLKTLMMWGASYPNVTDTSVFRGLTQLESVMIILPNVKDLTVFAQLPNLESLWINCHQDADPDPVIKAEHIRELMVNAQTIR